LQLFIEIYGFLAVVLRGFILTTQSVTVGGLAFLALALPNSEGSARKLARRFLFWNAVILCCAEALSAVGLIVMLHGTLGLPLAKLADVNAAIVALFAALFAAGVAVLARREGFVATSGVLCAALLAAQVAVTHAASRPEHAGALYVGEFAHMVGVGVWIGGIPYFLLALARTGGAAQRFMASRFSMMSLFSVATLLAAGLFLAKDYVGEPAALYGASYGVMLSAKIALLAGLLLLGAMNFLTVRRLQAEPNVSVSPMRRFAEVEIGVGLTALFCAASLTSLPPARDLPDERASFAEVVERVAPRWPPRLESPDHASLSTSLEQTAARETPRAYVPGETQTPPRNAEDIAWSEYNHHWAGLFVIAMGALALAERNRRLARFARHWPLIFLGLAAFVFVRADEAAWPLGHIGFFDSLRDPEIAQHKFLMLLIAAFGVFEWRVRLGRLKNAWAPYVFPLTTAIAAAFLLTHSHGLANPKEEMLIEITHMPLALVGVAAGWARWLELRLDDGPVRRIASMVWPIAFVLAGLLLLFYREA
jgi:putative copper resistance protein D